MQEGDAMAASAGAGQVVNELIAEDPACGKRRIEVGNPVADVVDAGTAFGEEAGDWGVRRDRLQEFDIGPAEVEVEDPGTIGFLRSATGDLQDVAVEGDGLLEAGDGDAKVRYCGLHAGNVNECGITQERRRR